MNARRIAWIGAALLAPPPAEAQGCAVDHVIHVSVDGLPGIRLEQILEDDTSGRYPAFARLVVEGAGTFAARTDFTHTITLPSHVTMITGRPVLQPAGQAATVHHGYTNNGDPDPSDTLHNTGNPNLAYVASIFDVAHDHGLSTALFASKDKFVVFDRSYDATNGAPDLVGVDDGRDKIDVYVEASTGDPPHAGNMHADLLSALRAQQFAYTFVHYRDLDSSGHEEGWGSSEWQDALEVVDGYVADLLDLAESEPGLAGRTALIVTADHGGTGTSHSDPVLVTNYTIPFLVWGPGVQRASELYSLNTSRQDPGSGRPDYDASPQPVRNGDGANLALGLLGLPPIPGSTIDSDQDLFLDGLARVDPYGCTTGPAGDIEVLQGIPRLGRTLVFGLDDPLGRVAPGARPILLVSRAPDSAHPCGSGRLGPGIHGEVLVGLGRENLVQARTAPSPWIGPGVPALVTLPIPRDCTLVGATYYTQGILVGSRRSRLFEAALTRAVRLRIGP